MMQRCDLIVIGAGPAGCRAALAAAQHGLAVTLIDEAAQPGGQVFRAPAAGLRLKFDDDALAGDKLRAEIATSAIARHFGCRVWAVTPPAVATAQGAGAQGTDGYRADIAGPSGHVAFAAPQLIAATGAHERVVPFPGWTLPGVIGLAAATILLKSQGMLPGRRVVIAGCGPLLAVVAAKVAAAGGEIAAIVDRAAPVDWLAALPGLARRPRFVQRGLGWLLSIGRARVPLHFRHAVVAAEGDARVARVRIARVDRHGAQRKGAEQTLDIDTLVVGHGLVPGAEIPRLLRAAMAFDRMRGGWTPRVDGFGRTNLPGLFVIGDGAGIRGAEPALLAGEMAGLTAALDARGITADQHRQLTDPLARQLGSYAPLADAMAGMMALRPAEVAAIVPDTIVCRCEDVTRREIEGAAKAGARDVNQMKHFTRCGMGPCQGRMCGDVAAELLALTRKVPREAVGQWTMRPPLRPVPLEDLVGTFQYSDIPIPKPAPL